MTAVEWLVKELNQKIDFIPLEKWDMIRDIIQKAKEMEKEQRVDDYVNGMHKGQEIYFNHQIRLDVNSINYSTTIAEQYYNEIYTEVTNENNT
jgi:hypothetical protein